MNDKKSEQMSQDKFEAEVAARDTTFDNVIPERLWISTRTSPDRKYILVFVEINGIEKEIERIYVGSFDGLHSSSTQLTWVINSALTQSQLETQKLKEEVIELTREVFFSSAHFDKDKNIYDTMALSHVRDAGDRLVELGVLERLPDGFGRRWFYREALKGEGSHEI